MAGASAVLCLLAGVTAARAAQRVTLDRVVAVVNGDLILESDVDMEQRFRAFQSFSDSRQLTRDEIIERLIDRQLILEQLQLQPVKAISDDEVDAQLETLRKAIPACAQYHCETDAGWAKFTAAQGFTVDEVRDRWRRRMEVLQFIEDRFRMGVRISQQEIDDYYNKTLTPEYAKRKAKPPEETAVSDRIEEVLLQQQVTSLLDEWLKTLRAQGGVKALESGEAMP